MALVNDFLIGADPEFIIVNGEHMVQFGARPGNYVPWGLDHGGWVIEPHPKPALSVREIIQNIRKSLNDFATVAPEGKWRAGAYFTSPERHITLGGHVHIDHPQFQPNELVALDLLHSHMEALDLFPKEECVKRRGEGTGYGRMSDVRAEHGHCEYRTFPSWLFSQRIAKLCLVGSKLVVADSKSVVEQLGSVRTASLPKLKKLFESFKAKDDDVDWLLTGKLLDKDLKIRADRDLHDVWKVKPEKETPHWKEEYAKNHKPETAPWVLGGLDNYAYLVGQDIVVIPVGFPAPPLDNLDLWRQACAGTRFYPRHLLVHGMRAAHVGKIGGGWPAGVAGNVIRHEVDRVRYRWRVLATQSRMERVIPELRAYILESRDIGRILPATVQLIAGIMVQFLDSAPVPERDLDNNF